MPLGVPKEFSVHEGGLAEVEAGYSLKRVLFLK